MYFYGLGFNQNYYQAELWFRLAAEQGGIEVTYLLENHFSMP